MYDLKPIMVSLFDKSGIMAEPWNRAGYECWIIDICHPRGINQRDDGIYTVGHDLLNHWLPPFDIERVHFTAAFPPCDHVSVSGSRWFKGKGLRALAWSLNLFATAAEFCQWTEAPYLIENPVSTISTYWRKPDYVFSPHQYTGFHSDDNYTKKTCLWVGGGFVMPDKRMAESIGDPDDRIHKAPPSDSRKEFRSQTPRGFSEAVFIVNEGSDEI